MFASSKLPLTTGFLAMYRLSQSKNAIAARELRRHLGVCCRSAWTIKHKPMPRQAVIEPVLAFTKAALTDGARWVNVVLGNRKRSLDGTCHAFGFFKHAERYLAEAAWRVNRCFDLKALGGAPAGHRRRLPALDRIGTA